MQAAMPVAKVDVSVFIMVKNLSALRIVRHACGRGRCYVPPRISFACKFKENAIESRKSGLQACINL